MRACVPRNPYCCGERRAYRFGRDAFPRGRIAAGRENRCGWQSLAPAGAQVVDLAGRQVYPGLIALDTTLGLIEIEGVRATDDTSEVGDYSPDVESWIAVNPDSELLPVARGGASPTSSRCRVAASCRPIRAHAARRLDHRTDDQPKEARAPPRLAPATARHHTQREVLRPVQVEIAGGPGSGTPEETARAGRVFDEARAYAKAKDAAANGLPPPEKIPAWEAMLPYARGERPLTVHADALRQISTAVAWAVTNHLRIILAGGRDAWLVPELLATNHIPVIYEQARPRRRATRIRTPRSSGRPKSCGRRA